MAGGKTTQTGLGDRKPNRSTRMGLKVERKKIVTKRGMVAPSPEDPARLEEFIPESDRKGRESEIVRINAQLDPTSSEAGSVHQKRTDPIGMTPPPPIEQMQLEASDCPEEDLEAVDSTRELETDPIGQEPFDREEGEDSAQMAASIAAHEDITPREGSDLDDPDARSRFRTAPGGGLNRISGGREHARAYVSPVTVKPGTPTTPVTGAVKVMDIVEKAVRAYQTEPSLLRRRLSSLPPALSPPESRMHLLVGAISIGLILGAMVVWAVIRTTSAESEQTGPATKVPPIATSPAPAKKQTISRNDSETGPKRAAEGESKAPQGVAPREQEAKPSVTQEKPASPTTSISQSVSAQVPVVNPPRSDTKPAVKKATSAEAKKPPTQDASTPKATKTSPQDLWLE